MFNYQELEKKYLTDAPFNRLVNLHRRAIEDFGFTPDEMRQATFLAQYFYQTNNAEQIIRTQKEWEQIERSRKIMKEAIFKIENIHDLPPPAKG